MSYTIVRVNDEPNSAQLKEIIIDASTDVSALPTDVADGSSAYTKDLSHIYLFKGGAWTEVG